MRGQGVGVVLAQDADTVGQDLLVQGDGFGEASRRRVCVCEVVAQGQGVGVVVAQDADTVWQDLLVQGDGLGEASRRTVCVCEVVARGQGAGVIWAQQALKSVHGNVEGQSLVRKPEITRV